MACIVSTYWYLNDQIRNSLVNNAFHNKEDLMTKLTRMDNNGFVWKLNQSEKVLESFFPVDNWKNAKILMIFLRERSNLVKRTPKLSILLVLFSLLSSVKIQSHLLMFVICVRNYLLKLNKAFFSHKYLLSRRRNPAFVVCNSIQ